MPRSFAAYDHHGVSVSSVPDLCSLVPALHQMSAALRQHSQHLNRVLLTLNQQHSVGVHAIDRVLRTEQTVGANALAESVDAAASAGQRFCDQMDDIRARVGQVHLAGDGALGEIREAAAIATHIAELADLPCSTQWQLPPDEQAFALMSLSEIDPSLVSRWGLALRRWHDALELLDVLCAESRGIAAARSTAELQLVSALSHTLVGAVLAHTPAPHRPFNTTAALAFSGQVWGRDPQHNTTSAVHARQIASLTASLIEGSGRALWDDPPTSELVATRWQSFTHAQQQSLITNAPEVIGNLAGLPYTVRDRANRLALAALIDRPHTLTPTQLRTVTELSALLSHATRTPPQQLISFDLTAEVPRVALAIGDVEHATDVTWVVAGMRNDAPESLAGWAETTTLLYGAQSTAAPGATHAVIAWLGYDTPELGGVLTSHTASAGAPRFAHELDATHLAPGQSQKSGRVHVLAHSYGTTLASIALTQTKHHVSSFTMLGSAGIDTTLVPTLSALHVDHLPTGTPAIFTGHAVGDGLAPIGAAFAGRALPHTHAQLFWRHATDTVPVVAGALEFPVTGDPQQHLAPTDGHDVRGTQAKASVLGVAAQRGHGYLDPGTQSLNTVARITTNTLTIEHIAAFDQVACPLTTHGAQQPKCTA